MKKLLTLSTVALLALAMGIGAKAAPQDTRAALERTVQRDTHRIHQLQNRRAFLHRYIRHLRKTTTPTPHVASGASSATQSASTTSYTGPLRISATEAAQAMRSAGFPESVIPYFISTIIPRESGFCPTAVYPGHCGDASLFVAGGPACSLFQLFTCPGPQAADPYVAARYAYSKYRASGLAPWGG